MKNIRGLLVNRLLIFIVLGTSISCSKVKSEFDFLSDEEKVTQPGPVAPMAKVVKPQVGSGAQVPTTTITLNETPSTTQGTTQAQDNNDDTVRETQLDQNKDTGSPTTSGFNYWVVNFEGGTVTPAQSSIIKNRRLGVVTIDRFAPADLGPHFASDDRQAIIDSILNKLKLIYSGVNIRIVTQRPVGEPYSIIHVGGRNFTRNPRAVGVAPLDIHDFDKQDIAFAFSQSYKNTPGRETLIKLAYTIAHEMGHAMGLQHIDHDLAIMQPRNSNQALEFDVEARLVSNRRKLENSLRKLVQNVGKTFENIHDWSPPEIVDLARDFHQGITQISVYTLTNFRQNPDRCLTRYEYTWKVLGGTVKGTSFRTRRIQPHMKNIPVELTAKVTYGDGSTETKSYNLVLQ